MGEGGGTGVGAASIGTGSRAPAPLLTLDDVSMWEQLSLAAFLQRHWADNQVSCTVTFDPEREGPQIARALETFQYQLKGVSLLPRAPKAQYKQLPYEAVSEAEYRAAVARIRPGGLLRAEGDAAVAAAALSAPPDAFCDSSSCEVLPGGPPAEEAEDMRPRG